MLPNPHLPPEILDYILGLLRGRPGTPKECSLVSKSWVPPARKHLFAEIGFFSDEDPESWMETPGGRSESSLSSRCAAGINTSGKSRPVGNLSRLFPQLLRSHRSPVTLHQVTPRVFCLPPMFAGFRPRPFAPSSQGPGLVRLQPIGQQSPWTTDRRSIDLTHIYRIP